MLKKKKKNCSKIKCALKNSHLWLKYEISIFMGRKGGKALKINIILSFSA